MYKFLCGHMFSFLLGIYLGVELLGHKVALCLTIWGTASLLSRAVAPYYIFTSSVWWFQLICILANCWYYLSFWLSDVILPLLINSFQSRAEWQTSVCSATCGRILARVILRVPATLSLLAAGPLLTHKSPLGELEKDAVWAHIILWI